MRKAKVFRNGKLIGTLTEHQRGEYEFRYTDEWFLDLTLPAVSLTMPKTNQVYKASHLFPPFFNILSEGINKRLQCRHLKIDENDHFGLLLATAQNDTIGPITVQPVEDI